MYTGHVRHLTMDPSARVKKKGTFAGIIERIPYLQALGINMLELQPVYEFGELHGLFCPFRKTGPSL